jgi:hypothetical protein
MNPPVLSCGLAVVLMCVGLLGCGGPAFSSTKASDAGELVDAGELADAGDVPADAKASDAGELVDEGGDIRVRDSAEPSTYDAATTDALVHDPSDAAEPVDVDDAGDVLEDAKADAGDACIVVTSSVCAVAGYPYYRIVEGSGGRLVSECCAAP